MSRNLSAEAGSWRLEYRRRGALRGRCVWIPPTVLNTVALFSVCFNVRSHFSPRSVSETHSLIQESEEHSSLAKGDEVHLWIYKFIDFLVKRKARRREKESWSKTRRLCPVGVVCLSLSFPFLCFSFLITSLSFLCLFFQIILLKVSWQYLFVKA